MYSSNMTFLPFHVYHKFHMLKNLPKIKVFRINAEFAHFFINKNLNLIKFLTFMVHTNWKGYCSRMLLKSIYFYIDTLYETIHFFLPFHTGFYSGINMFWQPHANKIECIGIYMGYKVVSIHPSLCHLCFQRGPCILNIGGSPMCRWRLKSNADPRLPFYVPGCFFHMQKIFLKVWNEELGSWYQMTCGMAKLPLHHRLPSSQATFSIRMFPSGSSSSLRIRADHLVFLFLIKAAWERP